MIQVGSNALARVRWVLAVRIGPGAVHFEP